MEETKICSCCHEEKPIDEYYKFKDVRGKERISSRCKACRIESVRIWREKNKSRHKDYTRQYRAKNKEKMAMHEKKYYEKQKAKKQNTSNDKSDIIRIEKCLHQSLNATPDISKAIAFKKQFFQKKLIQLRTVV
ncbi:hypothetical protein KDU71_07655 [Carboxylicivirga sediminis]|uniref:Uncharacterized protein n=1 Tax=Carboxylicivirga sediminis TaxID=2006564 RepID=A0A941F2Y9_9BACT|nr:hypothetical protein [Carboxylicivirga sediminis]MBR8535432.1 hypothetical protein [Carboxylicivirga sediminis]